MRLTQFHFVWQDRRALRFRTGVSLHSHTLHSQESFGFLPRYLYRVPVVAGALRAQERKCLRETGRPLDYSRAWWTPPLPAREAFEVERRQIEDRLDCDALVSLSDHDNIEACAHLQVMDGSHHTPIDRPVRADLLPPRRSQPAAPPLP